MIPNVYDPQITIELSNVLQEAGARSASASFAITEWLIDGERMFYSVRR